MMSLVLPVRQVSRGPTVAARPSPAPVTHLTKVAVPRGGLALTFDDGPDPTWTPLVLALLARAHVHATFCMVGREVVKHPELVRAVVAAGHTLCDHTFSHDEQLGAKSPQAIAADIGRTYDAILAASGGVKPVFFRAPGGNWTPRMLVAVRAAGLTPLGWTVDPRDWSRPGVTAIRRTALSQARRGGIVLLHDGGGDRSQTLGALRELLTLLPQRGFTFDVPSTRA